MFEKHKAKKAAEEYQKALSEWQAQRDGCAELVQLAQSFKGTGSDGQLMLKPGEAIFYKVTGSALIEVRHGAAQWKGHSQGFSIPVGSLGGRSVRYRVGQTRGHLAQSPPVATAIDRGTLFITNQRVVFQGGKQTRECAFAKLIGFEHSDTEGSTTFSVSNRQKPTTVRYGAELSGSFDFRLDLALAHFQGKVADLAGQVQQDLVQIEAARPSPPPAVPA